MSNFLDLILEVMHERNKTIKDLEENKVLGKNTFYIFSETNPSLKTIIKIANYLETSIDYLIGLDTNNNFKRYKLNQTVFYEKLINLLIKNKISQVKLCEDLKISRSNFSRWNNGTAPSISKLIDLSKYLNCNIDDLLDHE